jgi:disintegrin and metalloproteinase domain-containing protein 17
MGGSNSKTTVNYLISLIGRVHNIFSNTVWRHTPESAGFSGMGFIIRKIIVHRQPTQTGENEVHYNMLRTSWSSYSLVAAFSRQQAHKDFCLAHLFTNIIFEDCALGRAYLGSPNPNTLGGICTPEYLIDGHTFNFNSGFTSSRNPYGGRYLARKVGLTAAHEFGHNWGSGHDPSSPECSPSPSQGGSYIMWNNSQFGNGVNNNMFSPCSVSSIGQLLLAKSSRCFTEPEDSFCGNLRVEGEEECDAGLLGLQDRDPCCNRHCKLKAGSNCSDSNSPCCLHCQHEAVHAECWAASYAACQTMNILFYFVTLGLLFGLVY